MLKKDQNSPQFSIYVKNIESYILLGDENIHLLIFTSVLKLVREFWELEHHRTVERFKMDVIL